MIALECKKQNDSVESPIFLFWFLEFHGGEITGKAVVLSLAVDSLRYDHYTRRGTVRMRIGENQFEDARRYARKNIELIVRDKNIALSADVIPPAARFRILGESLKGNVLEMNFEAE